MKSECLEEIKSSLVGLYNGTEEIYLLFEYESLARFLDVNKMLG